MMESTNPRVLLLTRDEPERAMLERLARSFGADVSCRGEFVVLDGPWSLVCLDEVLCGSNGDDLEEQLSRDCWTQPVLWLSPDPRGPRAATALARGAADVLGLPLWEPEARARMGRWLAGAGTRSGHGDNDWFAEGGARAGHALGSCLTGGDQLTQGLRDSEKLMTVGQIAAGIAHAINNPLTAVSSYAQLLGMQAAGTQGAESARRIQAGIERIHRLVQNLMSFDCSADDAFYPLDLNEVVTRVLSLSSYEVARGDTHLEQALLPRLPRVLGAEVQLEQLLMNLLTNARDAVDGRGRVLVATNSTGNDVVLTVRDDGVGIEPSDLGKVFEPFYTTKPVGKGTGLGLFVAAGIAEKHRGRLQLDSRPGQGTEARLILPAFCG